MLSTARGFSLLETLIAAALIATAVATLAYVVTVSVAQNSAARRTTTALVLAQSKLEELRTLDWRFTADGSRASSGALAPSPESSLTTDLDGWTEALDRFGDPVDGREAAHYRRRWAVTPQPADDDDTVVLQVCVFARDSEARTAIADACVFGVRTRKP